LVSREFFLAVKERPKTANISSLRDGNNLKVNGKSNLEQVVTNFYRLLYAASPDTESNLAAENLILSHVPCSFSSQFPTEVLDQLSRLPSSAELKAALDDMATGRSPGPDGILTEFLLPILEYSWKRLHSDDS
jgi:hypothetical protein